MLIGASYYSECWPIDRYPVDAQLMAAAGFNVVRMGEFAWSRFQPTKEEFKFDWMDECIGHLKANGIRVLLGTPTRVAPPWLVAQDRSVLIVNEDGSRAAYGGRYEFCLNHEGFREAAAALVQAMVNHYRHEDGIFAWHLDNEYGVGICYCDRCAAAFQAWLRQRYGSLAELNSRWGSAYWSTEYTAWEQIGTPRKTENRQNPAVYLDYRRFFSDVTIGFARMAADIIRRSGDRRPIVTNLHSSFEPHNLDYTVLNEFLDVAATNNNMPQGDSGQMNLDLVHGLKRAPFWSVEQRVSGGGVPIMTPVSRPGDARRWTYLTIGHGADAVMYWAWRRYLIGQEQYWGGILEHDGELGRFYYELQQTAGEISRLQGFLEGTDVIPEVGILNSYDNRWALDVELNHPDLAYEKLAHSFWRPLRDRGISCEFTHPEADLCRYRLVIAPTLLLVNHEIIANLRHFVEQGGILLLTVRCGVKDWNNKILTGDLLTEWRSLTGIRVAEFSPLTIPAASPVAKLLGNYEQAGTDGPEANRPLQVIKPVSGFLDGSDIAAHTWVEVLEPISNLETLATYGNGHWAGSTAIARRRLAAGQVITLGTVLAEPWQGELVDWLLAQAELCSPLATPQGVEVLIRRGPAGDIFFLLNHTDEPRQVLLPTAMQDLLSGAVADGQLVIPERGVQVLLKNR